MKGEFHMRNVNVRKLTGTAMLIALVVLLQALATIIRPGFIPVNLVLPIIVVGAGMYGAKVGALLGVAFACVVIASGISGAAPLSTLMWTASPVLMVISNLVRGAAFGFAAGAVYNFMAKRKPSDGALAAAIVAPIVDTLIFLLSLIFFFQPILVDMAGDTNIIYHAFIVMAGTNFLVEMLINVGLVSVIVRLVQLLGVKEART
jgi:uncharacterized membrane protein